MERTASRSGTGTAPAGTGSASEKAAPGFGRAAAALLRVPGLASPEVAARVQERLSALAGVFAVRLEPEEGLVRVTFDSERTPVQELLDVVMEDGEGRQGYRATLVEATW